MFVVSMYSEEGLEMFLTKECDYGIRIIRALMDGTKKTVESIAEEQHIPTKYAYKIIKKLDRAGFVRSVRGRGGGYHLLIPLDTFTLADIVKTIDANRYVSECLRNDSECPFKTDRETPCNVHRELERIQTIVVGELQSIPMDIALRVEDGDFSNI